MSIFSSMVQQSMEDGKVEADTLKSDASNFESATRIELSHFVDVLR